MSDLKVGDRVTKKNGYPFEGTVQAVFTNRANQVRVVVELSRSFDGDMLHIFNPEQLSLVQDPRDTLHRLEALGLPTRVHNLLVDAGYTTVEQLQDAVTNHGFFNNNATGLGDSIRGFGFHSYEQVQDRLQRWTDGREL